MGRDKVKMMIVDDELPIREWLNFAITSLDRSIEIVGVCKDGKEALSLYMDTKPDICIADIKMPNMNGIELLQKIKAFDQDAYVIMLTSHDDFELARQSLKYGATEYILKNEITADLLATIIDNYALRNHSDNNSKFHYDANNQLKPYFAGDKNWLGDKPLIDSLQAEQFVLSAHMKAKVDTSLFHNLGYKVDGILSGEVYRYDRNRVVFTVQLKHYNRYLEKYNTLLSLAKEIEGICESPVGACEITNSTITSQQAVHKSLLALGASYYDEKPNCLYTKVDENTKQITKEVLSRRNKIVDLINRMYFDQAKDRIMDYFAFIKDEKILNIELIKQSLIDFIASYKLYKLQFDTEQSGIKSSIYQEKIILATSINEMALIVNTFIDKAFDIEASMEHDYSIYVNKAIAYIKEKYGTIGQIKDVSNYLGLNQEYLCRMFKSETGDTLNNYLTKQRINIACRLLRTTPLKVNEIAELVGYNSLSYFSRAFSKKMDQSPHDYRLNS